MGATDDRAKSSVFAGMRPRFPRCALCVPEAVPAGSRRGILQLRADARLANIGRVDFRAADVSTRTERRLRRTVRWRFPPGLVAVDPGLSARRSAFLAGCPAP